MTSKQIDWLAQYYRWFLLLLNVRFRIRCKCFEIRCEVQKFISEFARRFVNKILLFSFSQPLTLFTNRRHQFQVSVRTCLPLKLLIFEVYIFDMLRLSVTLHPVMLQLNYFHNNVIMMSSPAAISNTNYFGSHSAKEMLLLVLHSENRTTCSRLLETALNNVLLSILFNVVNNIVFT